VSDVTDPMTQHPELGLAPLYSVYDISGSHSNIAEGLSCLECDAMSLGKYFSICHRILLPLFSGVSSQRWCCLLSNIRNYLPSDTASHPRRLEYVEYVVYEVTINL